VQQADDGLVFYPGDLDHGYTPSSAHDVVARLRVLETFVPRQVYACQVKTTHRHGAHGTSRRPLTTVLVRRRSALGAAHGALTHPDVRLRWLDVLTHGKVDYTHK